MREGRRWFTFGLLALLLVALGVQPALGAPGGKGRITKSYRADSGKPVPEWAQAAIDRGKNLLAKTHSPNDLKVRGVDLDDLGMQHVRFDQVSGALPVFGGQLVIHVDAAGNLRSQTGRIYAGTNSAAKPALSPNQAIAKARSALAYTGQFAQAPVAQLLILPLDSRAILAYQVTLEIEDGTDATAHHQYFVDANDGSIVWNYDSLPHDDTIGTGNSLYSGTVQIHTDRVNGVYEMRDNTRGGMFVVQGGGPGTLLTDSDNVWGDGTNADPNSAGVDAHFGAAQTWDYYLNIYGRRGIDNNGFQIMSRVHYGSKYNNAFWNGKNMTYGDGDGVVFSPLVALDVAGHEITHGLTQFTANLIYANESGALNESFSDIFGTAVEFYTGSIGARTPDYFIGEDIYLPADNEPGFRNMKDPLEDNDPDNYAIRLFPNCKPNGANDGCGVHSNSGIQNNAFYLLAEGGTNRTSGIRVRGIGRAEAEAIFYRALTVYLFPSATFQDARIACINAAADLYGANSSAARATAQAWTAVGVN
jgi:Zn-dependent metalloprotease